ncbi:MAG: 2-succinyl-5-enolpyruvyl-6-hydroxy-3-cyclohexene-1-carboxylic-acid synthase [Halobacteriaceae archaeon]
MSGPNPNTRWGRAIVAELVASGIEAVCISPGSRSTPLTVAAAEHEELRVFSHLDERSAAFFALGRARITGRPTPLICTSGTAAANYHPAVIEADRSRVPMLLLTADRPRELQDSGANQTIDQTNLYGSAVRWFQTLPDPEAEPRKLRSVRTTTVRALGQATGVPAGPVHLNVPFRKPLEPTGGDEPTALDREHPDATAGREGPFVEIHDATPHPDATTVEALQTAVETATRPLVVAGPADDSPLSPTHAVALCETLQAPLIADPLSELRYGPHVEETVVCGGYDAYLTGTATADWPDPDLVIRVGASPTSKALRTYLAERADRQIVVDPAGGWREAAFTATALVPAAPDSVADAIAGHEADTESTWRQRWIDAEGAARSVHEAPPFFEGAIAATVAAEAPPGTVLMASNSMPVRDLDRFGQPRPEPLHAIGNRGASGIDGITSTALGAGSATDGPLVVLIGDLAYYHDMNGLLAIDRCDVDATIVLINNDGGGIFHKLPIASHDTFEPQFRTPHGLDFEPTGDVYDFSVTRVGDLSAFEAAYTEATADGGTQLIEVMTDAGDSHEVRSRLEATLDRRMG